MRKASKMLLGAAALATVGLLSPAAHAVLPTFPSGPWTFDLEDRSSLYSEPVPVQGGPGVFTPLGPGAGQSIGAPGASGFYAVGFPGAVGPITQRSIFKLKDVNTGTVLPIGDFGMTEIATVTKVGDFQSIPTMEGTGVSSGTVLSSGVGLGGLPPGAGSGDGLIGSRLWFGPDSRVAFTDLVPSTSGAVSMGGLNASGLATAAGGFGGLVHFYADITADGKFGNGLGDAGWSDIGSPISADPSYPLFGGPAAGDDHVLVATGVFTPLYNADVQAPADPLLLALAVDTNFGAGTYAAAKAAGSDAVLIEDFTGPGGGSGVGFINIIDALPAFLQKFTPDYFGPGRDLRLSFQTTIPLDAADANGNGFPDQKNIIDNNPGGANGPGWNIKSTDPVQGFNGIPEPATASLGAMLLAGLGSYATRRRRK